MTEENVFRITSYGDIKEGMILKYQVETIIDGAYYGKGGYHEAMWELFKRITDDECMQRFGKLPTVWDNDSPRIGLCHMPFFDGCTAEEAEPMLYFRYSNNGTSIVEANQPELLLPYCGMGGRRVTEVGTCYPFKWSSEIDGNTTLYNKKAVKRYSSTENYLED